MSRFSLFLAFCVLPLSVRGDTIFSQNFDALAQDLAVMQLGSGVNAFTAIKGTNVDIVGSSYGLCVGLESGNCVDLNGTNGNPQGILETTDAITLLPDTQYTLSFDLIGSQRDTTASATVTVADGVNKLWDQTFTLASNGVVGDGGRFTQILDPVSSSTAVNLTFASDVPGNIGLLLDDVEIKSSSGASSADEVLTDEIASLDSFGSFGYTGAADLSGTLDVELDSGFIPAVGESFQIVSFDPGTLSGSFSNIENDLFNNNTEEWVLTYDNAGGNVSLTAEAAPSGAPEPATLLLLGIGLLAIGVRGMRRAKTAGLAVAAQTARRRREILQRFVGWPLIALAALLPGPRLAFCSPVVLYNNFGTGNSFGPMTDAYCIGGNNPGCAGIPYEPAFAFTPGTTAYLTEIELAVYNASQGGAEGSAVISLVTGSSGLPGSTVLEQWTIMPSGDGVYTLNSVLHPLLTAGTQYWLVAANTLRGGGVVGWNTGLASQPGPYADMKSGSWALESSNAVQGAFEVLADTSSPATPLVPTFTISTVAGDGTAGYSGDGGLATSAAINDPYHVAVDSAGNLYIADFNNQRIRKVTPAGAITTVAGSGAAGFSGDNGLATSAELYYPSSVFVDVTGNLLIADQFNGRVRKVSPSGIITTVAGPGPYQGYCGDGGPATSACLNGPIDAVSDAGGNIFISEFGSNAIRKVATNGIITTVAGGNTTAGYSGDGGPATAASLSGPAGVAVDPAGNVFIGDLGNYRIRKVTNGIITTVAGNGKPGYSGDGGPATSAELNIAGHMRLDAAGNLYIPDQNNNRIRILLTNGTIATVAGNGNPAYSGDGGAATNAAIDGPHGVAILGATVYVADGSNNRIRLLTPSPQTPAVTPNGIVSASAFGGFAAATAGSWIEIYGSNLGPSLGYTWQGSDFNGNNAPTGLKGVSLKINGISAFLDYVSATQVNAQVPGGVGTGPATVVLTNSNGSSAPYTLTLNALEPGLLAPSSFTVGGKQYVVAFNSDGSYTLPTTSTLGLNSRPAKPGETIVIYGVGFGPAASSGGSQILPGVIVTQANQVTNPMQIAFGGTNAALTYQGLAPGYVGLYQFNVVVPSSSANSDTFALTFNVGGNAGNQTLYTAVHN